MPGGAGRSPGGRGQLLPSSSVPCPQLNVTARSAQDGGFLEMERLRLSSSATEHRLPELGPGSSLAVTLQGLTAAGAGAASRWESPANSSGRARRVPGPRRAPRLRRLRPQPPALPPGAPRPGHEGAELWLRARWR